MSYFTKDFLLFFKELEKNNNREWFNANKKRFEAAVKKPFEAFVAEMIERIHAEDANVVITPKDAIFRIYRDTRFSPDKTPYKLHMAAVISQGGRKDHSYPGIYIQFGTKNASLYSGAWSPDKDQLYRIRESIAANPKKFKDLISDKNFVKKFGTLHGEKNKRLPPEFREAGETQPLIYNKSFYFYKDFKAEDILKSQFPDTLMEYYRVARPLSRFFSEAMNP